MVATAGLVAEEHHPVCLRVVRCSSVTGKDTETAMDHSHHTHESSRPGGRRVRSRWWAVGLAGMTGLALTTVGVAAPAAGSRPGTLDRASTDNHRGEGSDKSKGQQESKGVPVPCDPHRLIAAIALANARGGAVLDLATKCTYTLTADIDGAGLPAISTPITLNGGKHTTITRAAAADEFRILTVSANGRLTLSDLTITGGASGNSGGGILIDSGGAAAINSSKIIRNVANSGSSGGGIANIGGALDIKNSSIVHNVAAGLGGGIFSVGTLSLYKSRIDTNTGGSGGGGLSISGSFSISRSEIAENETPTGGGGIVIQGSGFGKIADTRIVKNVATGGQGGAAIFGAPGKLTISRSVIADNAATSGQGGALFLAFGAMLVEDSVIKNNIGINGGGIRNQGATTLLRTKVTGNQATGLGGGIFNTDTGTLSLFTTKILKNISVNPGGGIFNQAGGTVNLNTATGTTVVKNRPNNCVNVTGCPG
ncbi:hypothetical protein [Salinispora arenicola]|uniref:hypothetical protein n=1 Tax=Salinispora arenicola TaxID=168697 RepID=UPI0009B7AAEA|nr:hypothetical protein [Salinispora arenicola]